jgi:heat-inducible transcriptional repressor
MRDERPPEGRGGDRPGEEPLSERERQVLQALVDAHIQTAEPVGSKALAQITEMGLSPASIRNVLAALHEKGLIDQPHTSAGRVPTDRGLRYYVDCLLQLQQPTDNERGEIAARIGEAGVVDAGLREASRVLTRLSRHTTVLVAPRPQSARLKHVELVRLRDDAVLLILVTTEGKVQNRLLEWRGDVTDRAPEARWLEQAARRVTELVEGRTIDEAQQLLADTIAATTSELEGLERRLLQLSAAGMAQPAREPEVLVEGTAHLLETTQNLERTRALLSLLEEDQQVKALLERAAQAPGIRIFIGEENPAAALSERGVVTAALGPGGALGVLGVIGPRHLDYGRVVPLVDLTAQIVRRTFRG